MNNNTLQDKNKEITKEAESWKENNKNNRDYNPLIAYYFVNKTLNMSAGKQCIQVARAGQMIMCELPLLS